MRRLAAAGLWLAILSVPAQSRAAALYFCLEEGGKPILGCVYPSPAASFGTVRLDLDGDGDPREVPAGESSEWGSYSVSIPREGRDCTLELHWIPEPGASDVSVSWTATAGEDEVFFINGLLHLYPSREEAVRGVPFRMGPPFRFDVAAVAKGPGAALTVALRDGNGATLRSARHGGDERRIEARLLLGALTVFSALAQYG